MFTYIYIYNVCAYTYAEYINLKINLNILVYIAYKVEERGGNGKPSRIFLLFPVI